MFFYLDGYSCVQVEALLYLISEIFEEQNGVLSEFLNQIQDYHGNFEPEINRVFATTKFQFPKIIQ